METKNELQKTSPDQYMQHLKKPLSFLFISLMALFILVVTGCGEDPNPKSLTNMHFYR